MRRMRSERERESARREEGRHLWALIENGEQFGMAPNRRRGAGTKITSEATGERLKACSLCPARLSLFIICIGPIESEKESWRKYFVCLSLSLFATHSFAPKPAGPEQKFPPLSRPSQSVARSRSFTEFAALHPERCYLVLSR